MLIIKLLVYILVALLLNWLYIQLDNSDKNRDIGLEWDAVFYKQVISLRGEQMKRLKEILPGLAVAIIIGVISIYLARFVPQLGAATIAIFLGIIIGNFLLNQDIFKKGYNFAESDLLSYSIS